MPIEPSTKNISHKTLLAVSGMAILSVCTGLYEAGPMPKDEIFVSATSLILLSLALAYTRNLKFINIKLFSGFIAFNAFFILGLNFPIAQNIESKTYLTHFISLGAFLTFYHSCELAIPYNSRHKNLDPRIYFSIISVISLAIILLNQILELQSQPDHLLSRPGGLLNPNTTASISLILLFTIYKLSINSNYRLVFISTLLSLVIIMLSQSRAAIIVFLPFAALILTRLPRIKYLAILGTITTLILLDIFLTSISFSDLLESILTRLQGESSSHTRLVLLQHGWQSFIESPMVGNGYQHTYNSLGYTTHNQILEVLTNNGLIGLFLFGIAFYLLYIPFSLTFCLVCVAPTLLFSSNFFDIYAIQASLGYALLIDRYCSSNTLSKSEPT